MGFLAIVNGTDETALPRLGDHATFGETGAAHISLDRAEGQGDTVTGRVDNAGDAAGCGAARQPFRLLIVTANEASLSNTRSLDCFIVSAPGDNEDIGHIINL
jgi:hypothetical protein